VLLTADAKAMRDKVENDVRQRLEQMRDKAKNDIRRHLEQMIEKPLDFLNIDDFFKQNTTGQMATIESLLPDETLIYQPDNFENKFFNELDNVGEFEIRNPFDEKGLSVPVLYNAIHGKPYWVTLTYENYRFRFLTGNFSEGYMRSHKWTQESRNAYTAYKCAFNNFVVRQPKSFFEMGLNQLDSNAVILLSEMYKMLPYQVRGWDKK
jgi:hypothetical protein